MGADDYVAKPFGMSELVAASRRCSAGAGSPPRLAGPRSSRCRGSRSTPTCTASSLTEQTPGSRRSSSGSSRRSPPRRARPDRATSCASASGACPSASATARWTCACASCGRRSTFGRARTSTSTPIRASAIAARFRAEPPARHEPEHEVELRAAGSRLEQHRAAGCSGRCRCRPSRRGRCPLVSKNGPSTVRWPPGRNVVHVHSHDAAHGDADALALVAAGLRRVGGVEDRVVEREQVAGGVARPCRCR